MNNSYYDVCRCVSSGRLCMSAVSLRFNHLYVLSASSVLFTCLFFLYISVCLSVCQNSYISVCLSTCLSVCLSVYLSVCLLVCLSACLSVCFSVCLSACLSTFVSTLNLHTYIRPSVCLLTHYCNPSACAPRVNSNYTKMLTNLPNQP